MKKRIVLSMLVLGSVCNYSFGYDKKDISETIKASFSKEFVNARSVQWENKGELIRADFMIDDQVMDAYFGQDGKLIAVTRNIVSNQLPILLFTTLKKDYDGYWITDLFEISVDGETSYYISLKNARREMVLRSDAGENWEIYKSKKELLLK
jgi:hypothetical protein